MVRARSRYVGYSPMVFGGVDAGACDAPIKMTWPGEVDDFKARLGTLFEATDLGIRACAGFDANDRRAWELFLAEWRTFRQKPTPTFGSYGDWVTTCTYAKTLDGWRDKLTGARCVIPGPKDLKGYELPQSAESAARWIGIGLVATAAIVTVVVLAPEIKGVLGRFKR